MAKNKRKKGKGQLSRGPWTASEIIKALEQQGYGRIKGDFKHENYEHPGRPGKVQISMSWTGVKYGGWIYNRIAENSGYGKKGLQRILNGLDP
jgi:hypothetical protein